MKFDLIQFLLVSLIWIIVIIALVLAITPDSGKVKIYDFEKLEDGLYDNGGDLHLVELRIVYSNNYSQPRIVKGTPKNLPSTFEIRSGRIYERTQIPNEKK